MLESHQHCLEVVSSGYPWTDLNSDQMYFPYLQDPQRPDRAMSLASFLHPAYMTLVVRTDSDPAGTTKAVETLVQALDRDAPVSFPLPMDQAISRQSLPGPSNQTRMIATRR